MSANIRQPQVTTNIQVEREFLMAKLSVPVAKADKFKEQVRKVRPVFETAPALPGQPPPLTLRWQLAISGVTKRSHDRLEFLHIWKTPKVWSLYSAMNHLASDREYAALHDCVQREEQYVLGTENMYSPTNLTTPVTAAKLVVESFALPSDRGAVARLQFGMPFLSRKLRRSCRWRLLLALQHETGVLGTRIHVWGVEPGDGDPPVAELIALGKKSLEDSDLYQSQTLLRERARKRAEHCQVRPRFEEYDPVDYRNPV